VEAQDTAATVRAPDLPPAPDAYGPEAVRVTYTLTAKDVRRAATGLSRFSVMTNALGSALVLSGLFTVVANGDLVGILIGLLGVLFLTGDAAGLITSFMVGRRPDLLREPVSLTVSADGIRTVTRSMSGEARWSSYKRVRTTGTGLVLELGTGPAVIIPTSAFTPVELERIRGWAAIAGVLASSSPMRAYVLGFLLGLGFNLLIFGAVVVAMNV
jgi:hypothetical protein